MDKSLTRLMILCHILWRLPTDLLSFIFCWCFSLGESMEKWEKTRCRSCNHFVDSSTHLYSSSSFLPPSFATPLTVASCLFSCVLVWKIGAFDSSTKCFLFPMFFRNSRLFVLDLQQELLRLPLIPLFYFSGNDAYCFGNSSLLYSSFFWSCLKYDTECFGSIHPFCPFAVR